MVYTFLVHKGPPNVMTVPFKKRWKVIPKAWRRWWEQEFAYMLEEEEDSLFVDVTAELEAFEKELSNMKWKEYGKEMDKHCAFPEVRSRV